MSRRANPAADRAAQNQQTIKNLLKLNCNKTCADCKRNKHPRWASWNLGVFICIRCSGIHRGMGTHISRVKSVDLDSWTDEQLQSVLKWGNARANKYWEAKLTPGHIPSEAKIENFIRTKYEARRWVMDGPMPDPSTLDVEGDDDVPLAVVQEKAKLERSASERASSAGTQPPPRSQQAAINLFDDDNPVPPARPNTTDVTGPRPSAKPAQSSPAAPQKQAKPADSLLGLDFFGPAQPTPITRPSSTVSNTSSSTGLSRPDLKQSILSLYSSVPKPQSPPQHDRTMSFGSLSGVQPPQSRTSNDAFSGLTDAFSGLKFPSNATPSSSAPKQQSSLSAFDSLASPKSSPAMPKLTSSSSTLSGPGLLDSAPSKPEPKPQQARNTSFSSGSNFDLIGATMGSTKSTAAPPSTSTTTFDLFSSSATTSHPAAASTSPQTNLNSVFNLSSPPPQPTSKSPSVSTANVTSMLSTSAIDPWGGNAWATPEPTQPPKQNTVSSIMKVPDTLTANDIGSGWGASTSSANVAPTVSGDEDFGSWTSPVKSTSNQSSTQPKTSGGFAVGDDLFGNVWQ
ncbi:hypothetical protein VTO42DRAFT_8299 [Malbranchea cinnamomea]